MIKRYCQFNNIIEWLVGTTITLVQLLIIIYVLEIVP